MPPPATSARVKPLTSNLKDPASGGKSSSPSPVHDDARSSLSPSPSPSPTPADPGQGPLLTVTPAQLEELVVNVIKGRGKELAQAIGLGQKAGTRDALLAGLDALDELSGDAKGDKTGEVAGVKAGLVSRAAKANAALASARTPRPKEEKRRLSAELDEDLGRGDSESDEPAPPRHRSRVTKSPVRSHRAKSPAKYTGARVDPVDDDPIEDSDSEPPAPKTVKAKKSSKHRPRSPEESSSSSDDTDPDVAKEDLNRRRLLRQAQDFIAQAGSLRKYYHARKDNFKSTRNWYDVRFLGRLADLLRREFGVAEVEASETWELLLRRIAALELADSTGQWKAAELLESGLVSDTLLHPSDAARYLRMTKELGPKAKAGGGGGGDKSGKKGDRHDNKANPSQHYHKRREERRKQEDTKSDKGGAPAKSGAGAQ